MVSYCYSVYYTYVDYGIYYKEWVMAIEDKVDRLIEQNDRIILLLEMLVGLDKEEEDVVPDNNTFGLYGEHAKYWFRQAGIE